MGSGLHHHPSQKYCKTFFQQSCWLWKLDSKIALGVCCSWGGQYHHLHVLKASTALLQDFHTSARQRRIESQMMTLGNPFWRSSECITAQIPNICPAVWSQGPQAASHMGTSKAAWPSDKQFKSWGKNKNQANICHRNCFWTLSCCVGPSLPAQPDPSNLALCSVFWDNLYYCGGFPQA